MLLPRCEGRFGVDDTGGIASTRAEALDAWRSSAFFCTAMPTACLVPVSAIVVASCAIPETEVSMSFSNKAYPLLTADLQPSLACRAIFFQAAQQPGQHLGRRVQVQPGYAGPQIGRRDLVGGDGDDVRVVMEQRR